MQRNIVLVLGILEGRGWHPLENHKCIIEANLDGNKLVTPPFTLSNSPKIKTEITWESDHKTIRNYKLRRIPIKIEVIAIDTKNIHKNLGYVVLSLKSAVEGIQADAKWFKLLGGTHLQHKTPPSILLQLHLEVMTMNTQTMTNGVSMRNGDVHMSETQRHNLQEKNISTNDDSICPPKLAASISGGPSSMQMLDQSATNGNTDSDQHSEELDLYEDLDCEDELSPLLHQQEDPLVETVEFSLPKQLNKEEKDVEIPPTKSEVKDKLLETRKDVRQCLQHMSTSLSATSPKSSIESSPYIEKRILSTSLLLDRSMERRACKSRKLDSSSGHSPSPFRTTVSQSPQAVSVNTSINNDKTDLHSRLMNFPDSTSVAGLLSQSLGCSQSQTLGRSETNTKTHFFKEGLVPCLLRDEGLFVIGPQRRQDLCNFTFSVSILFAKNLNKLINEDCLISDVRFRFGLLGEPTWGSPIVGGDLRQPLLSSEKATAHVRASRAALSAYTAQSCSTPLLPVALLVRDVVVGTTHVPLAPLSRRLARPAGSASRIDGLYALVSPNESLIDYDGADSPAVSVTVEVKELVDELVAEAAENMVVSSSDEEDTNCNENSHWRKQWMGGGATTSAEREAKARLHEAAAEVERWKQKQQNNFLKQWRAKEETLQRMLAQEWSARSLEASEAVAKRLAECDTLRADLARAISNLQQRETQLVQKERNVTLLEEEVLMQRKSTEALKGQRGNDYARKQTPRIHAQEASDLKEELRLCRQTISSQAEEILDLQRNMIEHADVIQLTRQKEELDSRVQSLMEKKQYYKGHWKAAIADLHKLHCVHKKTIEAIDAGATTSSEPHVSFALRVRDLKQERSVLLNSGLYSNSHSLIRDIDDKIREILEGSSIF